MRNRAVTTRQCRNNQGLAKWDPFIQTGMKLSAKQIAPFRLNKLADQDQNTHQQVGGKNPHQPLRHF